MGWKQQSGLLRSSLLLITLWNFYHRGGLMSHSSAGLNTTEWWYLVTSNAGCTSVFRFLNGVWTVAFICFCYVPFYSHYQHGKYFVGVNRVQMTTAEDRILGDTWNWAKYMPGFKIWLFLIIWSQQDHYFSLFTDSLRQNNLLCKKICIHIFKLRTLKYLKYFKTSPFKTLFLGRNKSKMNWKGKQEVSGFYS